MLLNRTVFLGVLAAVAVACFAVDLTFRLEGYPEAPWLVDLETIAFLALFAGGVALAMRVRVEKAERNAAEYKRNNRLQKGHLRVTDGGTGLPTKRSQARAGKANKRTPFLDGGTFHSRRWRKSSRH
jgi:hypothetical protein